MSKPLEISAVPAGGYPATYEDGGRSPAIAAMRHTGSSGSRKIRTFGAFCVARPISRGLVSFSESGWPITTAHPYFLLFDTAKLDRADAAYLRREKKLEKFFIPIKVGGIFR